MLALRRRELLALPLAGFGLQPAVAVPTGGSAPLRLLRTGDIGGLPWIELELQGASTRWLVDSGASAALISPALAERLKLPPLPPLRVAMAGGVQTLPRVRLPAMPGADADADMPAIALDLQQLLGDTGGRFDGALGAPWLRARITRFDFVAGQLRWSDTAPAPQPGAAVLPLHWDQGLPVLSLALGARAADGFVFDTGNAGALVLFAKRAEALLREARDLPQTTVRELGGNVQARFARIERLVAPGWTAQQVPAALESGGSARGAHFDRLAGSLGSALFEPGAVTLDGPGERLIVELPGLPQPPPLPGGFGFRLEGGSWLRIGAVIDGGPAAAAGVQAGAAVQALDGIDVRAWTPARAWQALAGREQVALQLYRDGDSRRVELRRERFFPLLR